MGAVANDKRVELTMDGSEFQKRVKVLYDNDELEWLGLKPFDLIGGFAEGDEVALLAFCAENPQYHIVSCDGERIYNRYIPDLNRYYLAGGEQNPYIVYNPWVDPLLPVLDWDVFENLTCDPREIKRRRAT